MCMAKYFKKLWGTAAKQASGSAAVQDDVRVYVIGDIHGRADLLGKMHELIAADIDERPARSTIEIYIGDYIDRGPDSRAVVETLSASAPLCDRRICLMGNHEQIFLDFIADPRVISSWMSLGGAETLLSYGVRSRINAQPEEIEETHSALLARLPTTHQKFIRELQLSYSFGPYFFVHAGVRPGVPLDKQNSEDLLWIREPFLSSTKNFGAVVVHGHTPGEQPVVLPNRICVDTGAYVTGVLTCLVLQGKERRFVTASR